MNVYYLVKRNKPVKNYIPEIVSSFDFVCMAHKDTKTGMKDVGVKQN